MKVTFLPALVDRITSAGVTCGCWRAVLVSATSRTSPTTCAGTSTASQTVCRSGTCWASAAPARTTPSASASHTRRPTNDDRSIISPVLNSTVPTLCRIKTVLNDCRPSCGTPLPTFPTVYLFLKLNFIFLQWERMVVSLSEVVLQWCVVVSYWSVCLLVCCLNHCPRGSADEDFFVVDFAVVNIVSQQDSCASLEIKASLEKSLTFRKLKKVLELFWKKRVEGLEKFGICLSWKFQQDLMTVRTSCHSCCKAGIRTAQTVLLINVTHECLKSMCPFLSTSRAVCCSMIDWKKGLELALKYWVKRPWKALSFFKNLWCRKPVSGTRCLCCIPHWITILTFPVCGCVSSSAFQHCHCWSLLQYLS